ncbi:MAG: hypothetical protein WD184_06275 [Acidimicrobiia bacterium]
MESIIYHQAAVQIETGGVITILRADTSAVGAPVESPLGEGDRFVMFLEYVEGESAPGISSVECFYAVLGGDDGVFQVVGDRAIARGRVQALLEADVDDDVPDDDSVPWLVADLAEVIGVVESVRPA